MVTTFIYILMWLTILWMTIRPIIHGAMNSPYRKSFEGTLLIISVLLLINMIYTGFFGWNFIAKSAFEWFLDIIFCIPFFIAQMYYEHTWKEFKKSSYYKK